MSLTKIEVGNLTVFDGFQEHVKNLVQDYEK